MKENGKAVTGWRVFDVGEDESVTLISAGCPEDYYHTCIEDSGIYSGDISEYILTGNIDGDKTSLNLDTKYTKRDWSIYANRNQKATEATALTKEKLDNWYNKYMEVTNADTSSESGGNIKLIYTTKYESLIDNYANYWLPKSCYGYNVCCWEPERRIVVSNQSDILGVRVLVTLSPDVKFSSEKVGTKTLTDPRDADNSWTYNVWDIK